MLEDYNLFLEHLFLEHPNVRKGIKGKDSRKEELVRTTKHMIQTYVSQQLVPSLH